MRPTSGCSSGWLRTDPSSATPSKAARAIPNAPCAPHWPNWAASMRHRSPICPCPSVSASINCLIQDPSIMRTRWRFALLGLVLSAAASPSFADDLDELRKLRDTTISLVNALVEQGVLTRAKADAIIAQAEQAGAKTPANGAPAAAVAGAPTSGAAPAGAPNAAPTAAGTTVAAAKPAPAAGATPGVASGSVAPS